MRTKKKARQELERKLLESRRLGSIIQRVVPIATYWYDEIKYSYDIKKHERILRHLKRLLRLQRRVELKFNKLKFELNNV